STGTLSGTKTVAAVAGVATFTGLSIDKAGTGYSLAVTGAGSATSTAFNITPATATALVFSVEPTNTVAGAIITPAVQITAQDGNGNTATGLPFPSWAVIWTRSEEHTSELQSLRHL